MTKKRIATMATCIALVGAVAVGGTLALLASESKQLVNTFSVSNGYDNKNGDFLIEELPVKQEADGDYVHDGSVYQTTGEDYANMVADSTLAKNPRFRLTNAADDELPPASWVVATISVDDIKKLTAKGVTFKTASSDWFVVTATTVGDVTTYTKGEALTAEFLNTTYTAAPEGTKYYFIYKNVIDADTADKTYQDATSNIFTELSVGKNFDAATFGNTLNLTIKGVAVQALKGTNLDTPEHVTEIMTYAVPKL